MSDQPTPQSGRRAGRLTSVSRLGVLSQSADWNLISDLYYWDKVEGAYERFQQVGDLGMGSGLGFFRMVEGEALTRKVSQITRVTPWLQLESQDHSSHLAHLAQEVCGEVAGRLGWKFEAEAMVSILVPDADVPWHSARYGYMMDKYPYDKVCLPAAALSDEGHLRRVLSHEYAHVITLNLTENRAPHWVEEGISTFVEGPIGPELLRRFQSGESKWRAFHELEAAFGAERRNGENRETIRDAYDQSRLLVEYLFRAQGERGLQEFLRAFTDNSAWQELKIGLGAEPVDEALRQVYGIDLNGLFQASSSWAHD